MRDHRFRAHTSSRNVPWAFLFQGDDKIELDNENNEKLCVYLHLVSAKLTGFIINYSSPDIYWEKYYVYLDAKFLLPYKFYYAFMN